MHLKPPKTLIILGPKAEAIAAPIRMALPALNVQVDGPEPDMPYALICFTPGSAIAAYRTVSWIHIAGAGANAVLDAMKTHRLSPTLITRTVGRMGEQIGEYVLSYVLAEAQKHRIRQSLQAQKRWDVDAALPDLVANKTALILGTGAIGQGVARALRAVGIRTLGANRRGRATQRFDDVLSLNRLPETLDIDICVGALPLTPETHQIINRVLFSKLDSALFINVGRGATADIGAVLGALEATSLRHAVLDVVPREPLPYESPLWDHPNLTITPHVSGITLTDDTADAFIAAYKALERNEEPSLQVNPVSGY